VAIGREPFAGVGRITISAGVCDLLDASGPAEMYARADGALLRAKSHGRDVVVRWSADLGVPSAVEPEPPAVGAAPQGRRIAARVADLALVLAGSAGWPADEAALLYEAALVHQMGRLRLGAGVGAGPGGAGPGASAISAEQAAWIRSRQERWDGGGGPDGLRGEEIPLGARLLAIADAFEEMIRPPDGGAGLAVREALATCRRGNGERFAPDAVAALERAWAEGRLRA
jgi:HD domain